MTNKPWVNKEPQPIVFPALQRSVQRPTRVDFAGSTSMDVTLPGARSCGRCGMGCGPYDLFCGQCGNRLFK